MLTCEQSTHLLSCSCRTTVPHRRRAVGCHLCSTTILHRRSGVGFRLCSTTVLHRRSEAQANAGLTTTQAVVQYKYWYLGTQVPPRAENGGEP